MHYFFNLKMLQNLMNEYLPQIIVKNLKLSTKQIKNEQCFHKMDLWNITGINLFPLPKIKQSNSQYKNSWTELVNFVFLFPCLQWPGNNCDAFRIMIVHSLDLAQIFWHKVDCHCLIDLHAAQDIIGVT